MTKGDRIALADSIERAPRVGADIDQPEGARVVQISDTLARRLAAALRGEDAVYIRIMVNGQAWQVDAGRPLKYRAVAELAGYKEPRIPSITWRSPSYPGSKLTPGNEIWPSDQMTFNVYDTSNA